MYLRRKRLHSPNTVLDDGIIYRPIHDEGIQGKRANKTIPCGNNGVIHDYIPFYLGPRSPMLLKISNGLAQSKIIYLYCSAQQVVESGHSIVFSDGHGIMRLTKWYDSLDDLKILDWETIYATTWHDTQEDPDRKRRKQAEFLVHNTLPWDLVSKIVVRDNNVKAQVESIFKQYDSKLTKDIIVKANWYY